MALKSRLAATQLMFITPTQPQLTEPGIIMLDSHSLRYDPSQLSPQVEDLASLLDPVLQQLWGQHLYRIVLTLRSDKLRQRIRYTIQ